MEHRTSSFGARGYTLLEQALATLVIGSFAAGAFGVGREIQAATALNAANETYLRCLTTLECEGRGSGRTLIGYDIYLTRARRDEGTWIPMHSYAVRERSVAAPVFRYDVRQLVLDHVHATRRLGRLRAAPRVQAAERDTYYRMKIRALPAARGTDSFEGLFLTYPVQAEVRAAPATTLDLSRVALSTSDPAARSAAFRVPVIASAGPCFHARALGSAASDTTPDFARACSPEDERNSTSHARIALLVRGTRTFASAAAAGAVVIALERTDGRERIDLGGRVIDRISASEPAHVPMHFVPRGIPISNVHVDDRARYSEYGAYTKIVIRRGVEYRIRFALETRSGELAWQGTHALLFSEEFESVRAPVRCVEELPASTRLTHCTLPNPALPADGPIRVTGTKVLDERSTSLGCGRPGDTSALSTALVDTLSERIGTPLTATDLEVRAELDAACPGEYREEAPCPAIAVGCTARPNGRVSGCREALDACPPPPGLPMVGEPEWSEREISLRTREWSPSSCAEPEPDPHALVGVPAEPKTRITGPEHVGSRRICLPGTRADDLLASSDFRCSRFSARTRALPEDRAMVATDSIFARAVLDLGCAWERRVLDAAEQELGADPSCELEAVRSASAPVCLAIPATEAPGCATTLPCAATAARSRTKLRGATDIAAPLPPQCFEPGANCEKEPIYETRPPSIDAASREALARARALASLVALYPGSRLDCDGSGCASFTYSTSPDGALTTHATFRIAHLGAGALTRIVTSTMERPREGAIAVR